MTNDTLHLEIDELDLPAEWNAQPGLFYRWSVKKADADKAVAEAKAALDVTRANLDLEVRGAPEEYGLIKATEASVANAIVALPRYIKAVARVNEAKHAADIAGAAVAALAQRKSALQALVDLHATNWHSQPRPRHAGREEVAAASDKATWRKGIRQRNGEDTDE